MGKKRKSERGRETDTHSFTTPACILCSRDILLGERVGGRKRDTHTHAHIHMGLYLVFWIVSLIYCNQIPYKGSDSACNS